MIALVIGGWPALSKFGLSFFTSTSWNPVTEVYGGAGPIVGTLITAILALVFALPIAVGVSVFLTEFCPRMLRRPIGIAVELWPGCPRSSTACGACSCSRPSSPSTSSCR